MVGLWIWLGTSYGWIICFYSCVWIISLVVSSRFIYHIVAYIRILFLFYGWILPHHMYTPHLVYPFSCQWTLELFPFFDYWDLCYCEHSCIFIYLSHYFQFFRVELLNHMIIVCSTFWGTLLSPLKNLLKVSFLMLNIRVIFSHDIIWKH